MMMISPSPSSSSPPTASITTSLQPTPTSSAPSALALPPPPPYRECSEVGAFAGVGRLNEQPPDGRTLMHNNNVGQQYQTQSSDWQFAGRRLSLPSEQLSARFYSKQPNFGIEQKNAQSNCHQQPQIEVPRSASGALDLLALSRFGGSGEYSPQWAVGQSRISASSVVILGDSPPPQSTSADDSSGSGGAQHGDASGQAKRLFPCPDCGKSVSSARNLLRHRNICKSNPKKEEPSETCVSEIQTAPSTSTAQVEGAFPIQHHSNDNNLKWPHEGGTSSCSSVEQLQHQIPTEIGTTCAEKFTHDNHQSLVTSNPKVEKQPEQLVEKAAPYICEACQKALCSMRSLKRHRTTCRQMPAQQQPQPKEQNLSGQKTPAPAVVSLSTAPANPSQPKQQKSSSGPKKQVQQQQQQTSNESQQFTFSPSFTSPPPVAAQINHQILPQHTRPQLITTGVNAAMPSSIINSEVGAMGDGPPHTAPVFPPSYPQHQQQQPQQHPSFATFQQQQSPLVKHPPHFPYGPPSGMISGMQSPPSQPNLVGEFSTGFGPPPPIMLGYPQPGQHQQHQYVVSAHQQHPYPRHHPYKQSSQSQQQPCRPSPQSFNSAIAVSVQHQQQQSEGAKPATTPIWNYVSNTSAEMMKQEKKEQSDNSADGNQLQQSVEVRKVADVVDSVVERLRQSQQQQQQQQRQGPVYTDLSVPQTLPPMVANNPKQPPHQQPLPTNARWEMTYHPQPPHQLQQQQVNANHRQQLAGAAQAAMGGHNTSGGNSAINDKAEGIKKSDTMQRQLSSAEVQRWGQQVQMHQHQQQSASGILISDMPPLPSTVPFAHKNKTRFFGSPAAIETSTDGKVEVCQPKSGTKPREQPKAPPGGNRSPYRYLCPECDKAYSCRKNVKKHRQSQHKVTLEEAASGPIKRMKVEEWEAENGMSVSAIPRGNANNSGGAEKKRKAAVDAKADPNTKAIEQQQQSTPIPMDCTPAPTRTATAHDGASKPGQNVSNNTSTPSTPNNAKTVARRNCAPQQQQQQQHAFFYGGPGAFPGGTSGNDNEVPPLSAPPVLNSMHQQPRFAPNGQAIQVQQQQFQYQPNSNQRFVQAQGDPRQNSSSDQQRTTFYYPHHQQSFHHGGGGPPPPQSGCSQPQPQQQSNQSNGGESQTGPPPPGYNSSSQYPGRYPQQQHCSEGFGAAARVVGNFQQMPPGFGPGTGFYYPPLSHRHSFDSSYPAGGYPSTSDFSGYPQHQPTQTHHQQMGPSFDRAGGVATTDSDYWADFEQIKSDIDLTKPTFMNRSQDDDLEMARIAADLKRSVEGETMPGHYAAVLGPGQTMTATNYQQHFQLRDQGADAIGETLSDVLLRRPTEIPFNNRPVERAEADTTFWEEDGGTSGGGGTKTVKTEPGNQHQATTVPAGPMTTESPVLLAVLKPSSPPPQPAQSSQNPKQQEPRSFSTLTQMEPTATGAGTPAQTQFVTSVQQQTMMQFPVEYVSAEGSLLRSGSLTLPTGVANDQQWPLKVETKEGARKPNGEGGKRSKTGPSGSASATNRAPVGSGSFLCTNCNRNLSTDYSLKRHRAICQGQKGATGRQSGKRSPKTKEQASKWPAEVQEHKLSDDQIDPDSTTFYQINESPPDSGRSCKLVASATTSQNGQNVPIVEVGVRETQ